MKGSQVGGTEVGLNWIGYQIHLSPGPALCVLPTVEIGKRWSRQRLQPAIDSSQVLADRVSPARERDSSNTIQSKGYPGGIILITGSNSAAGLRSMPVKYLLSDEIDAFAGDVDGEGDPVALAEVRTHTYHSRKVLLISTPTIRGFSRIEREFELSDQRYYHVPCPLCGEYQKLVWAQVKFARDDAGKVTDVYYECVHCQGRIDEHHKTHMLAHGHWVAENPGQETAGFHISALYSPLGWLSWGEIVAKFLDSKKDTSKLKVWTNTMLGETWTEDVEQIDDIELYERRQQYPARAPMDVLCITAGVDVQQDRLEASIVGWGEHYTPYVLDHQIIYGDPQLPEAWSQLDRLIQEPIKHESGAMFNIVSVMVDAGYLPDVVLRWTVAREPRRIYAGKGSSETGRPVVGRASKNNQARASLFSLGVDTAKDVIFAKMKAGMVRFPEHLDLEYFKQLSSEVIKPTWKMGRIVRRYVKVRERNEALDCLIYAYASAVLLNPNWAALKDLIPQEPVVQEPEKPAQVQPVEPVPNRIQQARPKAHVRGTNWVTQGVKW